MSEVQTRDFLERFAEVERAHPCLPRDRCEGEVFLVMLFHELPDARDLYGFSGLLLHHDLVGCRAELVGEELEQTHGCLIFAARNHGRFDIALGRFVQVEFEAPCLDLIEGALGLPLGWRLEEDLPGL